MSRFRRFDIVERCPTYFLNETSIFTPPQTLFLSPCFPAFPTVEDEVDCALDLLHFHNPSLLVDELGTLTDLIQIQSTPFRTSTRRVTQRVGLGELQLQTLCERVSDLELALVGQEKGRKQKIGEGKYTWTAEIQTPENGREYKWTAEIKRKGGEYRPIEQTYTIKVSSGDSSSESEKEEKKKKKTCKKVKERGKPVIVEIEEPSDHGGVVLRQVFAKRLEKKRSKSKELPPEDAAAVIQMSFRTHLIRRSQALRALRELAIAKIKLKELRALFNFAYCRRLSRDAEERHRFSQKIIVLLLTVDAIEGGDLMVRAAKKSMVDELETMLDMVDPQPWRS